MNIFYYNSVELPIITLSALKNFLQKINTEKSVSDAEILELKLIDNMFDLGTQIRFSIDKTVALAEIFTGKNSPKSNKKHENLNNYIDEIREIIEFLKNLREDDFANSDEKIFSHPIFFPTQKLVWADIMPFFLGNMYFHITTTYDILRHFGYNLGKKDFLGEEIFAKIQ